MPTAPFAEIDCPVVVLVDVAEEAVQPRIGDCHSCSLKGRGKLAFVQVATVVAVDRLEELPELLFRAGAETSEFIVADLAVVVDITRCEHIFDQPVCIFQC